MDSFLKQATEFAKKVINFEDSETKENLLDLKRELATDIVDKLEKEHFDLLLNFDKESVTNYLVHEDIVDGLLDSWFEKTVLQLSKLAPQLSAWREQIKNAQTAEALKKLETEILWGQEKPEQKSESTSDESSQSWDQSTSEGQSSDTSVASQVGGWALLAWVWAMNLTDSTKENSDFFDVPPEQKPYVEAVLKTAEKEIGKPYRWGAAWPMGFDCSGLWNRTFQKQGLKFEQRFTASIFSKTDVNISKEDIRIWDFMYWDKKPGSKKHNPIYHIEMVVWKPFYEHGKWYVKTLGSSTDTGVLNAEWKRTSAKGVGYRFREITDYRHFGRPPYYLQLAEHQKTGDEHPLIAKTDAIDRDLANKVTA